MKKSEKAEKTLESQKKRECVKKEKKHPILTKILLRIITILMIAGILFCAGYFGIKKFTTVKIENNHAMVEKQLSYCQELITAKYKYSDIVALKKSYGLSKSYSIVKYTGILRAGIADFTDISYSISRNGKKISLKIPQAELLGNDLIKQEVFDEKISMFVPITTQEIFEEIEAARKDAAEEMIAEGFLDEARTYAVTIITQFMLSMGFEEVVIN